MPCSVASLRVLGIVAAIEQAAMHLRMQRLHPAVHHLREAGQVGDTSRSPEAGFLQRLGRAAGRDQIDA
jgi:hypothetical protein